MTPRRAIIIVGTVGVVTVVAWIVAGRLKPSDEAYLDVLEHGQHIHVACVSAACAFEQADFRAFSGDMDWPKACPKCSEKTLYRAQQCYSCMAYTAWQKDSQGRVYCRKCKKWLNPPPGAEEAQGPAHP